MDSGELLAGIRAAGRAAAAKQAPKPKAPAAKAPPKPPVVRANPSAPARKSVVFTKPSAPAPAPARPQKAPRPAASGGGAGGGSFVAPPKVTPSPPQPSLAKPLPAVSPRRLTPGVGQSYEGQNRILSDWGVAPTIAAAPAVPPTINRAPILPVVSAPVSGHLALIERFAQRASFARTHMGARTHDEVVLGATLPPAEQSRIATAYSALPKGAAGEQARQQLWAGEMARAGAHPSPVFKGNATPTLAKPAAAPAKKQLVVGTTTAAGLSPFAAAQQQASTNPGGNIFTNAMGDLVNTVTALPNIVPFVGEGVGAGLAGAYSELPGGLPGAAAAGRWSNRVLGQQEAAVKATAADYAKRYGPTVRSIEHGHLGAAAGNLYTAFHAHPGLVALDAATAWNGLGAAIKGGELAGRVGAAAARGEDIADTLRTTLRDQRSPVGPRRVQPPRLVHAPLGENAAGLESAIPVPRNPLSANPLTRVEQRGAQAAGHRIQPLVDEAAANTPLERYIGPQARHGRAAAQVGVRLGTGAVQAAEHKTGLLVGDFEKAARKLDPIRRKLGSTVERDAFDMHAEGMLNVPGKMPVQARDAVVAKLRQSHQELVAKGIRSAAEKTADRYAAIPEHLLDLRTAPQRLQVAVAEAKKLDLAARDIAVGAGVVTPADALERTKLSARLFHGQEIGPQPVARMGGEPGTPMPPLSQTVTARTAPVSEATIPEHIAGLRAQASDLERQAAVPKAADQALNTMARALRDQAEAAASKRGSAFEQVRERGASQQRMDKFGLGGPESRRHAVHGQGGFDEGREAVQRNKEQAALTRNDELYKEDPVTGVRRRKTLADFREEVERTVISRGKTDPAFKGLHDVLTHPERQAKLDRAAELRAEATHIEQGSRRDFLGDVENPGLVQDVVANAPRTEQVIEHRKLRAQAAKRAAQNDVQVFPPDHPVVRERVGAIDAQLRAPGLSAAKRTSLNAQRNALQSEGLSFQWAQPNARKLAEDAVSAQQRARGGHQAETMLRPPSVPRGGMYEGGIYQAHIPLKRRAGAPKAISPARVSGLPPTHQNLGKLAITGNRVMNPSLVSLGAHRNILAGEASASLGKLIGQTAAKENGVVATGERALRAMQADPDHWVLVSRGALSKGLMQADQAGELEHQALGDGVWDRKTLHNLLDDQGRFKPGADKDVVAIPKRALGNWRASINGGFKVPVYDTLMGGWKAGLLALSPRWYAHNTLGNSAQYIVQSGMDIRSIHKSLRMDKFDLKGALPPGVAEGSFSSEAGAAARDIGLQAGPLKRLIAFGFRVNARMENVLRRASYLHAATKVLKQEGDLGTLAGSTRAAHALRGVAEKAARGDKQALAVVDEAVRQSEFFLGEYRRFNTVERQVLKRIFPFYCVDQETEALTQRGWVRGDDLRMTDLVVSAGEDGALVWAPIEAIYLDEYAGPMYRLKSRSIDALVTPGHKFVLDDGSLVEVESLRNRHRIRVMGEPLRDYTDPALPDAMVEVVGWAVTEGHYKRNASGNITTVEIAQKEGSPGCDRIRAALGEADATWHEFLAGEGRRIRYFGVTGRIAKEIQQIAPRRIMTPDFIVSLSQGQRELLLETLIAADGSVAARGKHDRPVFVQKDERAADAFVMLATLSGIQTYKRRLPSGVWAMTLRTQKTVVKEHLDHEGIVGSQHRPRSLPTWDYEGYVWCPKTPYGNFVCRRAGVVHLTGNSWLRVIGRLTFGLPFKHPLRAQAMTVLSQMGAKAENPMDWMLPIWQRGGLNIGGYKLSTTSSNPWATYQDAMAAAGGGRALMDSVTGGAQSMLSNASPVFQAGAALATGVKPFGMQPFTAPPGSGGSVQSYGQSPQRFNPATGQMESYTPAPSLGDFLLQQAPIVPQVRQLAADMAGGGKPYDTASTFDLIRLGLGGGGDKANLIQQPNPRYPQAVSSVPFLTNLSGFAGLPAYRYSETNAAAAYQQQQRRAFLAKRATEIATRRNRLRQQAGR